MPNAQYCALFIDFENLYYYLKQRLAEDKDPNDAISYMIRKLRLELTQQDLGECIVQHAYADFDRIEDDSQSVLYLVGVESHHVLGTEHKNAADMQLCIEAMNTLYTRPEIQTFVFMGGDRDYIPVIRHLRKHARRIRVVSFIEAVSGDLLQVAGEENFTNAAMLLSDEFPLVEPKKPTPAPKPVTAVAAPPPPPRPASTFAKERALTEEEFRAVEVMLEHFADKPEIWVTPYLHRLREAMPALAEYERKRILSDLAESGAIAVEKRPGSPKDYSVIVLNWNHPDVREANPL